MTEPPKLMPPQQSEIRRVLRGLRKSKTSLLGACIFTFYVFVAVFSPFITPHDPNKQNLRGRLAPPVGFGLENAQIDYPLGTDNLGRDILSRIIVGSRISLMVAVTTVALACSIGSLVGAMAGFFRGWFDNIVMRLVDIWMAFPPLLLAIVFGTVLGQGLINLILALVLTNWVIYSRVIRAEALVLREQEFVQAAHALGASDARIIVRHIMPNMFSSMMVIATLQLSTVIVAEASLSFLGITVQGSVPTWGGMLADGREYIRESWWFATFPGIAISVVVLSANLLGDGLRDTLDPRL
jgi:peptide/nickel transport system permease protein